MLKRNGEPREQIGHGKLNRGELNRGERDAYNEAFEAIQDEVAALERIKQNVKDLAADPVIFTIPGGPESGPVIHIQNVPIDCWQICSSLLKYGPSQIFLCERSLQGIKEFAVIEKFRSDSPYAQANGDAEVLLTANDPVLLVEEYAANAQQTLRSMASNLVGRAHQIVWQRYASTSPARVIQAISERCAEAASLEEKQREREVLSRNPSTSRTVRSV